MDPARPPSAGERCELHAELERVFQPYAHRIADVVWGKDDALPDPELVSVRGLESCPSCWEGEEDCEDCDGSGLLRRG